MGREIVFTFKRGKPVKVEVNGACGSSCVDLTKPFEERISGMVVDRELKPEYHDVETETAIEREIA
jgi:hypothetical protein